MKSKYLKWSKISLLLVCFGFFMPVSCDGNGVDITRFYWNIEGGKQFAILLSCVLIFAIFSIIFSLVQKDNLENEKIIWDWIFLMASICGGLFSLGRECLNYGFQFLQIGAFVIIIGWILSLIFLICASNDNENSENKTEETKQ